MKRKRAVSIEAAIFVLSWNCRERERGDGDSGNFGYSGRPSGAMSRRFRIAWRFWGRAAREPGDETEISEIPENPELPEARGNFSEAGGFLV